MINVMGLKREVMEEILIKTDNVNVRILELEEGEELPWHHHSEVTDYIFALEGEVDVRSSRSSSGAHAERRLDCARTAYAISLRRCYGLCCDPCCLSDGKNFRRK